MFVLILGHATDILCKFSAQKASGNLDSSEHIYLGGAHGVRAYPQGEGSGDEGLLGTVELRYHTPVKGLTLSTYLDAGHVEIARSGDEGNMTLKGWGVGLSYTRPGDWFAAWTTPAASAPTNSCPKRQRAAAGYGSWRGRPFEENFPGFFKNLLTYRV